MSEKILWKNILKYTPKRYKARVDEKGKPVNNVANFGMNIGDTAKIRRNGEYTGFAIMALEKIKPLLVDFRIARAIKFLADNSIQEAINTLYLKNEVKKFGIGVLYKVLQIWLNKHTPQFSNNENKTKYIFTPQEYINKAIDKLPQDIEKWVLTYKSEPINGKFKIVCIGKSKKGNSVVPDSWINRKFDNAYDLHTEMSSLDWRKSKPPVNFCAIYSIWIVDAYKWNDKSNSIIQKWEPLFGIKVFPSEDIKKMNTEVIIFKNKKHYIKWLNKLPDHCKCIPYVTKTMKKLIFCCDYVRLVNSKPIYKKTDNVGILVSRLQKCIRRGKHCSILLKDTIEKLSVSPTYNLPAQQFVRVSGSRQLAWRLFITTIEDVEPYINDINTDKVITYLSILDLYALAILANIDPDIQYTDVINEKLIYTAMLLQYNDDNGRNWKWRKGKNAEPEVKLSKCMSDVSGFVNAMKMALWTMPMMSGDKKMLKSGISYVTLYDIYYYELEKKSIANLLKNSKKNIEHASLLASYDMHCMPNIIIQLQSAMPFIPYNKKTHSTTALSKFIWDFSSSYNIRNDKTLYINHDQKIMLNTLKLLQKTIAKKSTFGKITKYISPNESYKLVDKNKNKLTPLISRRAFMLIFGQTLKLTKEGKKPAVDIIVSGNEDKPCKVKLSHKKIIKYLDDKNREEGELRYIDYMAKKNNRMITLPDAPIGFQWICNKKKIHIWVKNDEENIIFYANKIKLEPFDGSNMLQTISSPIEIDMTENIESIVDKALYTESTFFKESINDLMRAIAKCRIKYNDKIVYNWKDKNKTITSNIWKSILVKLYNDHNNAVQIGPVDRNGKKLNESINYLYEGTIMRIFNMFSMLYPFCVKPRGLLKFAINKYVPEYQHMLQSIKELAFKNKSTKLIPEKNPTIKTKLWDHQKSASETISYKMITMRQKGIENRYIYNTSKKLT